MSELLTSTTIPEGDFDYEKYPYDELMSSNADTINESELKRKELKVRLSDLMDWFDGLVSQAIDDGRLPSNANINDPSHPTRLNRIEQLTINIEDLSSHKFYGAYDPNTQSILINNNIDIDSPKAQLTLAHEMLHCYSGLTISSEKEYASVTRIGLQGLDHEKTKFLNEAYTHWAALSLLGINYDNQGLVNDFIKSEAYESLKFSSDNPFVDTTKLNARLLEKDMLKIAFKYGGLEYLPERIVLAMLDTIGIDLKSIGRAYFESYHRLPRQSEDILARHKLDYLVQTKTPYRSFNQLQILIDRQTKENNMYPSKKSLMGYYKSFLIIEQFLS